jgi:hypothetical protein
LRLKATNRGIESIEDTHNIVSKFDPRGLPNCKTMTAIEGAVASVMPNRKSIHFKYLNRNAPVQGPGHNCRAGNNCRA